MKKIVALLCCYSIAITIVFANAISTNDRNYYVLAKMMREQDKSIDEKEKAVTEKLLDKIKEISFFSEITETQLDNKNRIEILELQVQELQYQVASLQEIILKKPKPKKFVPIKPEDLPTKQESPVQIQNESELDAASSATNLN